MRFLSPLRLLVLGGAAMVAACSNSGSAPGKCVSCPGGTLCLDGVCKQVCTSYRDCTDASKSECRSGFCETAVCGNDVLASTEECDTDAVQCVECRVEEGYSCGPGGCSVSRYRVALTDKSIGWVDIIDVAEDGRTTIRHTYASGFNNDSPWAEWSADGTQLAYPGGPPQGQGSVYLYDTSTATSAPYIYFSGDQPSFAADRAEIVARLNDGYVRFTMAGSRLGTSAGGVQWPKWDPSIPQRFAYLNRLGTATSGGLQVYNGNSTISVATSGVYGYGWMASGGALYFLATAASACNLRIAVVSTSAVTSMNDIVTNVPCQSLVAASPGNDAFVAANADTTVRVLPVGTTPYAFTAATTSYTAAAVVRDLAWTPEAKYVAVLSGAAGAKATFELFDVTTATKVTVSVNGAYEKVRFSPELLNE